MGRARGALVAVIAVTALTASACGGGDDPTQDLPCDFYYGQIDSGVDVDLPEACVTTTQPG